MHCSEKKCNINVEREYNKKMDEIKQRSSYSHHNSGDDYITETAVLATVIATMAMM
jgi:hypothetical protein